MLSGHLGPSAASGLQPLDSPKVARIPKSRAFPAAARASASTSSRCRSSTFTMALMIRCLGSLAAKWTSSARAASRSAEAFGM
jgi:hypothetical protein